MATLFCSPAEILRYAPSLSFLSEAKNLDGAPLEDDTAGDFSHLIQRIPFPFRNAAENSLI